MDATSRPKSVTGNRGSQNHVIGMLRINAGKMDFERTTQIEKNMQELRQSVDTTLEQARVLRMFVSATDPPSQPIVIPKCAVKLCGFDSHIRDSLVTTPLISTPIAALARWPRIRT